ncbi:MAG: DUF2815 family protein [Bacteroidetes bacterium]|nr:DUF2815 family protein [Bacteroidota bacterium]
MSTQANVAQPTKVITGQVRLSYCHIFEPSAIDEGADKKYSVSIIIPKSDTATVDKIKKAVEAAKEQGKTSKFGGKIPSNLKLPLRDGDVERPDDEAYTNSYFINATSKTKPGVVDKDLNPVMDQGDVYSGCYGRVSINFYPFNTSGNKGIACGLNNIQKLKDGEPLGGKASAEADFGSEGFEDDLM